MSNIRFTGLLALCAVLAACSDSPTSRSIAPPSGPPSFDALTGADRFALRTVDLSAGEVGTEEAATGGRASGHADALTFGGTFRDRYSFIALSTGSTPTAFAGKGQFEGGWVSLSGPPEEARIHADIDCLSIIGNQAWASGPIRRFIFNGQEEPPPGHVLVRVIDRGEGGDEPDLVGFIGFTAPQGCRFRPTFVVLQVNQNGNIQVQQK